MVAIREQEKGPPKWPLSMKFDPLGFYKPVCVYLVVEQLYHGWYGNVKS